MNLLIISHNPTRASFRQRISVYLDVLSINGIHCEVAQLPDSYQARWKLFKQAENFDGVFLHKKGLNPFDAFWLRKYSKKIIYNFDDAIMYSDKSPERDSRSHFRPWRRSVKLADMVIAGSSHLAEFAKKFNSNVKVLPIGLKVSDYNPVCPAKSDDKIRLVWIGSKSTLRFLAEIKPALEQIGSCFDNVALRIISDDFLSLQNMEVEKRQWSKDTRALDLATCDIGLAPVPDNRFTRGKCTFKILEYAASGLPVVASPIGINVEYVDDGKTGFLATDNPEWVDKITKLIDNPQLRKQMGQQGLAQAKKFDVGIIEKQFIDLIRECLQRANS